MRHNPEEIPMPVDFSDNSPRIEPSGEWMTNLHHKTDTETLRKLREGSAYVLVTGWPKATEVRSVDELVAMGMVGVYVTGIRRIDLGGDR